MRQSGRVLQPSKFYALVTRIPKGRVATYGQIAALAGLPGRARHVGHALRELEDGSKVPWHRVVNAQGTISLPGREGHAGYQRFLLEKEGVIFDSRGRIDLERYRWEPDRLPRRPAGKTPAPSPARSKGRPPALRRAAQRSLLKP
jgi:methylated-DNA-protein-cysteine methyltransferase related protein